LPKLDLTTDAEYAANLVGLTINMWLQTCNAAVYYICMLYTCITTFFLLIS